MCVVYTDMILLYSVTSHRSWKGLQLLWRRVSPISLEKWHKQKVIFERGRFFSWSYFSWEVGGTLPRLLNLPEVLEASDHVGLEIVPSQAKLLLVIHFSFS